MAKETQMIFFSDTDSDLTKEQIESHNIQILKMPVYIDGEEYIIDLDKNPQFADFYAAQRSGKNATTAALNEMNYLEAFEPHLKSGKDILYIAFSSALSNTFVEMNKAIATLKEKYPKRNVTYHDTKEISVGAGMIALTCAKMVQAGKSAAEVVAWAEDAKRTRLTTFVVENLVYLKRGGRLSAGKALIGSILNLKPILKIDEEGRVVPVTKVPGFKKALMKILDDFKKSYIEDPNHYTAVCHADNEEVGQWMYAEVVKFVGSDKNVLFEAVGPVIGAHCGAGTIGITYKNKK